MWPSRSKKPSDLTERRLKSKEFAVLRFLVAKQLRSTPIPSTLGQIAHHVELPIGRTLQVLRTLAQKRLVRAAIHESPDPLSCDWLPGNGSPDYFSNAWPTFRDIKERGWSPERQLCFLVDPLLFSNDGLKVWQRLFPNTQQPSQAVKGFGRVTVSTES